MRPTLVFRTRAARPIAVAGWFVCTVVAVVLVVEGAGAGQLAWPACAALVLHAVWWRPAVEVSDGGIGVKDLFRDVHVPWPAVRDVESRWALTVVTEGGRHGSWAIPAASPSARRLRHLTGRDREEDLDAGDEHVVRPDGAAPVERLHGTAEAVAEAARARRDSLVRAGHLSPGGPVPPVAARWHVTTYVALAALLAVALLT